MAGKQDRTTEEEHPKTPEILDFYANSVNFNLGAFDAFVDFSLRTPDNPNPEPSVRIHMSIEHAWVMAKIIDRVFAQFRQQGGKFTIPDQVLNELGLMEEYRDDFGG
jgi:hypothetical protein